MSVLEIKIPALKKIEAVLEIKLPSTVSEIKRLVSCYKNQISSLFLKLTYQSVLESKISVYS